MRSGSALAPAIHVRVAALTEQKCTDCKVPFPAISLENEQKRHDEIV